MGWRGQFGCRGWSVWVPCGWTFGADFGARQASKSAYGKAMSESVEAIVAEAMELPPDQRLTLAHRILSSVEPMVAPEIEAAWDNEIRDRIARYDAGGARSIPATEVFSKLDRRLRR